MNTLRPTFGIRSDRQVFRLLALVASISVVAPVSIATALAFVFELPLGAYWRILSFAAIIPLLIAPLMAVCTLSIFRLLTVRIDHLDNCIRYDPLTGALSRVYLLNQAREQLASGGLFMMIDADHFKSVNDIYGHDVGDEALKCLAQALRTALPADALVGRLGGEEFGVLLPKLTICDAARVANDLCEAMRRSGRVIAGHHVNLRISIGIGQHHPESSIEQTMKLADQALYYAKRTGRDRYHIAVETDLVQVEETNSTDPAEERRVQRSMALARVRD